VSFLAVIAPCSCYQRFLRECAEAVPNQFS
jgi:hypothetical protein